MSDRQEIRARRLPLNERLVVNTTEAAELMGVSCDTFRDVVAPEIRSVRYRSRQHWPVAELQRWISVHMDHALLD